MNDELRLLEVLGDADLVMEALGRRGLTISVVCGPSAGAFAWSVTVLSRDGEEFDRPFAARDFHHAIEIAELECRKRGWL